MSLRDLPEIQAFDASRLAIEFEPDDHAVEGFNRNIRSAVNDKNSISLLGEIGPSFFADVQNTDKRVASALRAIGSNEVSVDINSFGGNVFHGIAIYNLLRAHPSKVTVNILGMAGSAASVIAMAGDEINMADGSLMMVHNASGRAMGNKFELEPVIEILGEVDNSMATIYAARAEVDHKVALAWLDKRLGAGTTFSVSSAIENNLADKRLDKAAIDVVAEVEDKEIPPERLIEQALMANGNSRNMSRSLIARIKGGKLDAAADVMPDADAIRSGLARLRGTLQT